MSAKQVVLLTTDATNVVPVLGMIRTIFGMYLSPANALRTALGL
jgi:hypothetical protein